MHQLGFNFNLTSLNISVDDNNRVKLASAKDDYINASYLKVSFYFLFIFFYNNLFFVFK